MSTGFRTVSETVAATVVGGRLRAIVDDMAATLANTANSPRISVRRQFACGLFDHDRRVAAADNPRYLGSLEAAARHCLEAFRFDLSEDDVIVTNDPYGGSPSVHYLTMVAPLKVRRDLSTYIAVQAHVDDLGGWVMGNYDPTARELRTEGVRFSPWKIVKFGRRRRDVFETMLLNSRLSDALEGDLNGMLAAIAVARRELATLVGKYGPAVVESAMEEAVAYGERVMRVALARIPEGHYDGEATFGIDDQQWRVHVSLDRDGDGTRLDFSQTDSQAPIFLNCPVSIAKTQALIPLLGLLEEDPPWSSGILNAVEMTTGEGTLVAPRYPAPTGWSLEHVGREVAEAVRSALAAALPDEVGPGLPSRSLAFVVRRERRVGSVEEQLAVTDLAVLAQPGSGAARRIDGWGHPGPEALGQLPSIEEFEQETDLTVCEMEYGTDSGGAGASRGAPGITTVIEFPETSSEFLYAIAGASGEGPAGICGGDPGAPGSISVMDSADTAPEICAGVVAGREVPGGALLRIAAAGGGGVGDPRERPPGQVWADVISGYVSPEAARKTYGLDGDQVPMGETAPGGRVDEIVQLRGAQA